MQAKFYFLHLLLYDGQMNQDSSTGSFWVRHDQITSVSGWGDSISCPCAERQMQSLKNESGSSDNNGSSNNDKKKKSDTSQSASLRSFLPELGSPLPYELGV